VLLVRLSDDLLDDAEAVLVLSQLIEALVDLLKYEVRLVVLKYLTVQKFLDDVSALLVHGQSEDLARDG